MQHGGDTDPRAEVLGIGRDGQHGVRSRAEQQVIDHSLFLPRDVGDLGGHGEHGVEVSHWQQVGLTRGQPGARGGTFPVRVGLHIVLFKDCSAFTRVTACMLARSPPSPSSGGFRHFVTSMPAPVASGWSIAGWDFHPLESAAFTRRTPFTDIPSQIFDLQLQTVRFSGGWRPTYVVADSEYNVGLGRNWRAAGD
eukprot:TRINITY_DN3936_c0_g1_i5.p1 TRINITY_DN3936_c0_g1~~TRINITY_DN3936_c0_g1_i5.p1  ORF type:complete len:195 (-),score=7.43 TRINITY_DN3936_c0_g1_i5:140-724(-)